MKAKVIKQTPFTIKLLYGSSGYKLDITLDVDVGSKNIGLSFITDSYELFKAAVELRHDISSLLQNSHSRSQWQEIKINSIYKRLDERLEGGNWLVS